MKRFGMMLMVGALLLALSASVALAVSKTGGPGSDTLLGTTGGDELYGEGGDDTLRGLAGPDRLFGGSDDDAVEGGAGQDLATGGSGNDLVRGGTGQDLPTEIVDGGVYGGPGSDNVSGLEGADLVVGGAGNDAIYGGTGDDFLDGATKYGDDANLEGSKDRIYCGDGRDSVQANTFDVVSSNCEEVQRVK